MDKMTTPSRRRGMAVVEAAVVMPLIVWLTLAIFEYGWTFHKSYQVGNVARVAARQAIMPDGKSSEVLAKAKDLLKAADLTGSCVLTPTIVEDVDPPATVTATVTADYKPLTNAPLLPVPKTLHASVTMNKEGF